MSAAAPALSAQDADYVSALVRRAGALAQASRQDARLHVVEQKGPGDLVTRADRSVQALLIGQLTGRFPDDGIAAEEEAQHEANRKASRTGRYWVIDPIDGTTNYARGSDLWSVSVGLYQAGSGPVFGAVVFPDLQKLVTGGCGVTAQLNGQPLQLPPPFPFVDVVGLGFGPFGVKPECALLLETIRAAGLVHRDTGCGTGSLLKVLEGEFDAYCSLGESSWDVMGMLPVLLQLGYTTSLDLENMNLFGKSPIICGRKDLVQQLSAIPFLAAVLAEAPLIALDTLH